MGVARNQPGTQGHLPQHWAGLGRYRLERSGGTLSHTDTRYGPLRRSCRGNPCSAKLSVPVPTENHSGERPRPKPRAHPSSTHLSLLSARSLYPKSTPNFCSKTGDCEYAQISPAKSRTARDGSFLLLHNTLRLARNSSPACLPLSVQLTMLCFSLLRIATKNNTCTLSS